MNAEFRIQNESDRPNRGMNEIVKLKWQGSAFRLETTSLQVREQNGRREDAEREGGGGGEMDTMVKEM